MRFCLNIINTSDLLSTTLPCLCQREAWREAVSCDIRSFIYSIISFFYDLHVIAPLLINTERKSLISVMMSPPIPYLEALL